MTGLLYNVLNSLVLVLGGKSKYQDLISLSYTYHQLIRLWTLCLWELSFPKETIPSFGMSLYVA